MRRIWVRFGILVCIGLVTEVTEAQDLLWGEKGMQIPLGGEPQEFTPFYQDQFSGKTVADMGMALAMVHKRFFNAPSFGSKAPNFVLADLETKESVFLEGLYAEKPVVLFFGSFGCNVMRAGIEELLAVHEEFKGDFSFVMIYIREAHSLDGFGQDRAKVVDPRSDFERTAVAKQCKEAVKIPFRILLDTIDDRVATRWGAWPIRLFVVDTSGIVVYSGKPGPWGFDPGKGFEADLAKQLRPHADRFSQNSLEEFLRDYQKTKE